MHSQQAKQRDWGAATPSKPPKPTPSPAKCTGVTCPRRSKCEQRGSKCNRATGRCSVPPPKRDGAPCSQGGSCKGGVCTGGQMVRCIREDTHCHIRCIYEPIQCAASSPNNVSGGLQHPASRLHLHLPQASVWASPAQRARSARSAAAPAIPPPGGATCRRRNPTARPAARAPARAACAKVGTWLCGSGGRLRLHFQKKGPANRAICLHKL